MAAMRGWLRSKRSSDQTEASAQIFGDGRSETRFEERPLNRSYLVGSGWAATLSVENQEVVP